MRCFKVGGLKVTIKLIHRMCYFDKQIDIPKIFMQISASKDISTGFTLVHLVNCNILRIKSMQNVYKIEIVCESRVYVFRWLHQYN